MAELYGRGNPSPTGLFIIHYSSFIMTSIREGKPLPYRIEDACLGRTVEDACPYSLASLRW